ncbi:MAG: NfeD family protein [Prolixibacteraceae bacterium]|jgi:membrane-bound ClpP family serine protease
MNFLVILFLIILGIILLLIEFTVLPGITIAGIGGFLLFGYSVYLAFTSYGNLAGFLTLAFILILSPILVTMLFKGKAGKIMTLRAVVNGVANEINTEKVKVGDIGVTIGRLAPMGKIKVNDEIIEVRSTGTYVNPGEKVRIIQIEKSLITVEPLNL